MINYCNYTPASYKEKSNLLNLIKKIDVLLDQPLSTRISLDAYVEKLLNNAHLIIANDDDATVGLLAFYCNSHDIAYLSLIGVCKEYQGLGLANKLLDNLFICCYLNNCTKINLECSSSLIRFYEKRGFKIIDEFQSNNVQKVHMEVDLTKNYIKHFSFADTPIEYLPNLSTLLDVNLYVKRDDLFPIALGGNKARKLQYILYKAVANGHTAVVTAGDINSNHNRATAIMCAKLGLKLKLIVHNDHPELEFLSMNMFLCRYSDAEIIYCKKDEVGSVMDYAMKDFEDIGLKPFYIWGGGHCLEGSYAYYDAVKEFVKQTVFTPDSVFFASGTGTTHAGLHVGFSQYYPNCETIGISIARKMERGIYEIFNSINELNSYLNIPNSDYNDINFIDSYIGNSYESIETNVASTIKAAIKSDGLILDPTYTGKAFYGMLETIKNNKLNYKNKNILFWHTGGIYNLLAHKNEL